MRAIILDVPDDVTDEKAQYELNRAFSPDWASLHWHISDVQDAAGDCTPMNDEDARDILEKIKYRHDCNNGVSWDTINHYVDIWRERLEEES